MPFFLVKVAHELEAGDVSAALKTLTSGGVEAVEGAVAAIEPEVTAIEHALGVAAKDFISVFAPAEATTILTSLSTTVAKGVKTGIDVLTAGTETNAVAGAQAAAGALEQVAENPAPAAAAPAADNSAGANGST